MFPQKNDAKKCGCGFPRARGDVPFSTLKWCLWIQFSPRTRGCSEIGKILGQTDLVFPAHAGMFPPLPCRLAWAVSFPRARGDVPCVVRNRCDARPFSPRTRGCSALQNDYATRLQVFPAHAGMFLGKLGPKAVKASFPRARGDVPHWPQAHMSTVMFSPRTRGCSLTVGSAAVENLSFPRARGDVPTHHTTSS